MDKELISDKQGIKLIILFIIGSTLVIGTAGQAKNDMWLSILIAMVASAPVLLVYARLAFLYPDMDLFQMLQEIFGKLAGKVIGALMAWYIFHLSSLVLRNIGEYINVVAMPETPMIVPMILFGLLCIWGVKEGIEVLARWGELFVFIVLGLLIMFTFLLIPSIDIDNLRPILYKGWRPVIYGAFSAMTFPFGETVAFIMVVASVRGKSSPYKIYLLGLLIGGITVLLVSIRNTTVLGGSQLGIAYFPSYAVISRVDIGNFLQRMEIAVSIVFLVASFIKICICLLGACRGVAAIFNIKDYRVMAVPVGLLMVDLSYIVYDSTMEMMEWVSNYWIPYSIPFEFLLPVITLITAEVKKRRENSAVQS